MSSMRANSVYLYAYIGDEEVDYDTKQQNIKITGQPKTKHSYTPQRSPLLQQRQDAYAEVDQEEEETSEGEIEHMESVLS